MSYNEDFIVKFLTAKGVNLKQVAFFSESAKPIIQKLTKEEMYDVISTAIVELGGKINNNMAIKNYFKDIESKTDKYDAVFASKAFNDFRKIEDEDIVRRRLGPNIQEGLIACIKCKSKKTRSYGKQTRSGDEGLTYTHTCQECGKQWTEY